MPGDERYLSLTSLDHALMMMREEFPCIPRTMRIPVTEAMGKISAEAVISTRSMPPVYLSAMDGIAVKSQETHGATDQHPIAVTDAVRLNTGNVIPDGYDAVVMIEDAIREGDAWIISSPVPPWQHIRPVGEDIAASEMIIPRYHRIRAEDIGALISYGITDIPVIGLRVALIPTGSEIVPVGTIPRPGEMIESNMHMAASLLRSLGAEVTHYPIVPDDPEQIRASTVDALRDHEIVLISAGSSKGTRDYTTSVITELGKLLLHGISIKPAKPVIVGKIQGKPVIGIPGYPVACHTILREIVTPLLNWYHLSPPDPVQVSARVTTTLHSEIGTDEFVLVTAGRVNDTWVAVPLSRGSGVQMSMVRSNGYLKIASDSEGLESGDTAIITLTAPLSAVNESVLITGSHDPCLDFLADLVRPDGISISSTHVGSMGGLLAMKKGDCHLSPMHLLSDDGEYNIPYLQKYIPDQDLVLICVAEREQGIVSRDGVSFGKITQLRYINRQRGSGTRMLLDHLLNKEGISPDRVTGYSREVTTHLAVCLSILSGDADMGMAVYSAAKTFGLAFIPVGTERYELATTAQMLREDLRIQKIVEAIRSSEFKEILRRLGGYRTEETGLIRTV